MRRSRYGAETSVGLFAFLDVLMSTMGSLILVLMIISPKIRQETLARAAAEALRPAEQPADPETPSPSIAAPGEVVDLNARAEREVAELSRQAQGKHRSLAQAQAAVQSAGEKLRQAQTEARRVEGRLDDLRRAAERAGNSTAQVAAEGIEIQSRLAGGQARLRTLRGEIAQAPTQYTFVAYDGVSGTTRRPILVECSRDHIKFLQEDVALSSSDLAGCTPSYNPLVAGCRALIDYWAAHAAPGDPKPYVLLVVRPSGSVAYYAARRMLERMTDPFGYELLADDQRLAVPASAPEVAAACKTAVAKSLAERNDVFASAFGNAGRGGTGGRTGRGGPSGSLFDDVGTGLGGGSRIGSTSPPAAGSSRAQNPSSDAPGQARSDGYPAGGTGSGGIGADEVASGPNATRANAPRPNGIGEIESGRSGAPVLGPPQFGAAGEPNSTPPGAASPGGSGSASPPELAGDATDQGPAVRNAIASQPAVGSADGGSDGEATSSGEPSGGVRERRWGLSSPGARIGFEHDARIHVEAAQITVDDQPAIACGRDETSEQLSAAVVAALNRDARTWGRPPENLYWVPNVKFVITPGGNVQYERIRKAILRHAQISSVEQRLDAVKPETPFGNLSE